MAVDQQLLFQRLISAARGNIESQELSTLFTYELATHPQALFVMDTLIRAANKPQIANTIWNQYNLVSASTQGDCKYVLDGGALLQRLPWPCGLTYDNLYNLYFKYVCQKYGTTIVPTKSDSHVIFCLQLPSI